MTKFLDLLKGKKYWYVLVISLATTVIILDTVYDFSEKIISKPILLIISFAIFLFLAYLAFKEELWQNEK